MASHRPLARTGQAGVTGGNSGGQCGKCHTGAGQERLPALSRYKGIFSCPRSATMLSHERVWAAIDALAARYSFPPPVSPSVPGLIRRLSTSRSGCHPTAVRAGRRPNHWPRSSRRPMPRSTNFWVCSTAASAPSDACRTDCYGAAARLRPGGRRRLLRRCRFSRWAGLGPDRIARRARGWLLCAQGAGRLHAAALPRWRCADRAGRVPARVSATVWWSRRATVK